MKCRDCDVAYGENYICPRLDFLLEVTHMLGEAVVSGETCLDFVFEETPMVCEGLVSREIHPPGLYLLFEATQMLGEAGKTNNPSIRAKNR